jgi:hypothetical protein
MMPDPISFASGGVQIAQGLAQFVSFLRGVMGADVISAYFSAEGTRLFGSERISVTVHNEEEGIWWCSVDELDEYIFLRMPVIESCAHELVGTVAGEKNADARYWRWVPPSPPGAVVGGKWLNVKVDFIVVGYRPRALIRQFTS